MAAAMAKVTSNYSSDGTSKKGVVGVIVGIAAESGGGDCLSLAEEATVAGWIMMEVDGVSKADVVLD